jgi:hypothetical protein
VVSRGDLLQRLDAAHSGLGEVHKEEMDMTTNIHDIGSERIHGKRNVDAKVVGKRNMRQKEFDREFT